MNERESTGNNLAWIISELSINCRKGLDLSLIGLIEVNPGTGDTWGTCRAIRLTRIYSSLLSSNKFAPLRLAAKLIRSAGRSELSLSGSRKLSIAIGS